MRSEKVKSVKRVRFFFGGEMDKGNGEMRR